MLTRADVESMLAGIPTQHTGQRFKVSGPVLRELLEAWLRLNACPACDGAGEHIRIGIDPAGEYDYAEVCWECDGDGARRPLVETVTVAGKGYDVAPDVTVDNRR